MNMENNKVVIKVEESIRDYVESIDYEWSTRRDAVVFMLSNGMNTNTDAFKAYQKEMTEFGAQFTQAKAEVERKYVLPETKGKACRWSLDYQTAELTITYEG